MSYTVGNNSKEKYEVKTAALKITLKPLTCQTH